MSEKTCKVTVTDNDGTSHCVTVTAPTLYTAAAAGLAALRNSGWANVPMDPRRILVSVSEVPVEHEVNFAALMRWADRPGGRSPAEITERKRVKELLRIPDVRDVRETLVRARR
jgi:hypothetical protein